ncbi:hypothetical protein GCM10012280_24930 [Wenjunlia tyrosinilytica]|uniref:Uncharacterized protein n=1 Tax=Wenjunlia tyrosinilytica TaxID=1544741 RepID=A0A917ZN48_9ACTN|nr:hypothetical protein GCM10012280_24930 [Wenjunlia tyrosinilytica]
MIGEGPAQPSEALKYFGEVARHFRVRARLTHQELGEKPHYSAGLVGHVETVEWRSNLPHAHRLPRQSAGRWALGAGSDNCQHPFRGQALVPWTSCGQDIARKGKRRFAPC